MQGKLCVICNQTQSGTNLPYPHVQIGKFHSFMLCCKAHLISSINVKKFEELIDHELDNLKKNGDWMVDELVEGLQPEEEEELEATPMCHSVLNLRDSNALLTCCTNLMSQHLWIHHHSNSNCILYFCKGSHLVRYLFSKFNKQGRKPGQELLAKKQRTTAAEKKAAVAEKKAAGKKVVGQKAVGKKVGVKGKTAPKAKKATKKGSNMDNTTPEAKADGETKGDNDDDHNAEGEGKSSCVFLLFVLLIMGQPDTPPTSIPYHRRCMNNCWESHKRRWMNLLASTQPRNNSPTTAHSPLSLAFI